MQKCEITGDNSGEFISLIGEDIADDLKRLYYRGIGLKDDDDLPAGALVYELINADGEGDTGSRILVARGRDSEVRDRLQEAYRDRSESEDRVSESIFETFDRDEADAFARAGFSTQQKESEAIRITVGDIGKLAIAKKKRIPDYISSLHTISISQYRRVIRDAMFRGNHGILEDLARLPLKWFDPEISACSVTGARVDGLFLVRRTPSGRLIPVMLYADGPDFKKTLMYLLRHSIKMLPVVCTGDTQVWVYRRSKNSAALSARLMPGFKGDEVFSGKR